MDELADLVALLREELDDDRPWVDTMAARLIAKGVHVERDCPEDCPYCAGEMCARFDGLDCRHDAAQRHGYPLGYWEGFSDGKSAAVSHAAIRALYGGLQSLR